MITFNVTDRCIVTAYLALRCIYTFDEAVDWLRSPHGMLGDIRPVDVIINGEPERVMTVIALLTDGAYA